MKKIAITFLLAGIVFRSAAQSFYAKVSGGYSFPMAGSAFGTNSQAIDHLETDPVTGYYDFVASEQTEEQKTGTFNTGAISAVTVGYQFSSNIGIEVNFGYVFRNRYKIHSESQELLDGEQVLYSSWSTRTWKAANTFVAPALVLTAGNKSVTPYLSAGPVFALVDIEESYGHFSDYDKTPELLRSEVRYSGGASLGVRGSAGLALNVSKTVSIFTEAALTAMSYHPREAETLKYVVNGEDQVPSWTASTKRLRYVSETYINTETTQSSPGEPSHELRIYFGMSSISVAAGLKLQM